MVYVDGYVIPVRRTDLDRYRALAEKAAKIWIEHGALEVRECIADDVKPGKLTSFPQAVQLRYDEIVIFSWILFESREARDQINAKVMKDPRLAETQDPATTPFDAKRMIFGGFESMVLERR